MKSPSETGMALILALVILTVISGLSMHILNTSQLFAKLAYYSQKNSTVLRKAELALMNIIKVMTQKQDFEGIEQVVELEFLPDHLEFGCEQGFIIYQASQLPFQINGSIHVN